MVASRAPRNIWIGKRERSARLVNRLGLFPLLERLPRRPCLIAFNYHRIGYPRDFPYDRGVVEATPDQFAFQMDWLKRHFHVARLDEAQDIVDHPQRLRHAHVLVTFDDGYRDNHDVAFPILQSLGVPATFFLPTQFVGSRQMPWWDQAADLVRRATRWPIVLDYPRHVEVDDAPETAIRRVLSLYKDPSTTDPDRFFAGLAQACGVVAASEAPERLFLSWDDARAMLKAGMSFGSHSHSHEILAKLTPERQREELQRSRTTLQAELGINAEAFAYPVGSASSFTEATRAALIDVGYRIAFSYLGGVNLADRVDRYNVLRTRLGTDLDNDHFRLRTLCLAVVGRQFI